MHPTAIDLERVDPAARPIVDKTIKEYKSLQADHTRKSQELAELKKAPAHDEVCFEDAAKDTAFKAFLKDPIKTVSDINTEIAKYDPTIPEDRNAIAYWQNVKDSFAYKSREVDKQNQQSEIDKMPRWMP